MTHLHPAMLKKSNMTHFFDVHAHVLKYLCNNKLGKSCPEFPQQLLHHRSSFFHFNHLRIICQSTCAFLVLYSGDVVEMSFGLCAHFHFNKPSPSQLVIGSLARVVGCSYTVVCVALQNIIYHETQLLLLWMHYLNYLMIRSIHSRWLGGIGKHIYFQVKDK